MRILLAEDDEGLRSVVERGLRENGYVVDAVADGDQAGAYLRSFDYSAVILDWRMPKKTGLDPFLQVTARLFARPSPRDEPSAGRRPVDTGLGQAVVHRSGLAQAVANIPDDIVDRLARLLCSEQARSGAAC